MIKNPFYEPTLEIKRRKNPMGEYAHLNTKELLDAVRQSAHSKYRADLDILLDVFLKRYDARQKELDSLNYDLEKRVKDEVDFNKSNQKKYEQQAKMAAMGEMMDAIAHQWKQPLNAISMMSDMLVSDFASGDVKQAYIDNLANDTQIQIQHMISTLNEFRNFFRPKETKENFGIKRCIQSVMLLVNDEFLHNNISINIINKKELLLYGIENEFKHLVLNIINNAKDAFNEKDIKKRDIDIKFYKKDNSIHLNIQDNAGGIPSHVINDIFKPEVTTKKSDKGTGIGLYMSMQIAQKLSGSLSVKNINNGACFSLEIPI